MRGELHSENLWHAILEYRQLDHSMPRLDEFRIIEAVMMMVLMDHRL